jgi:hypothetical protein
VSLLLSLLATACATGARAPLSPVDLSAERAEVEQASAATATEGAAAGTCVALATRTLERAEALADSAEPRERELASWLGTLASELVSETSGCHESPTEAESGEPNTARLAEELRWVRESQRMLEAQVRTLRHDLELTEAEMIRSKARLKGLQTKAEAAAAVAEARILVRSLTNAGGSPSLIRRCRTLVARAEQQLCEGNFGAAVFFASWAQDLASGREP